MRQNISLIKSEIRVRYGQTTCCATALLASSGAIHCLEFLTLALLLQLMIGQRLDIYYLKSVDRQLYVIMGESTIETAEESNDVLGSSSRSRA